MNIVLWVLFAGTIAGISIFHKHSFRIALCGFLTIFIMRFIIGFDGQVGIAGMSHHLAHELVGVSNIFLLITGFTIVAQYFERSNIPILVPKILPDDWKGGFCLLGLIFICSAFLDNIAAAMIGGTIATTVFRGQVTTGYVAALVAASNAGGAGSVIGDTTTTMMWISGISPMEVLPAYIGAVPAFCFFAFFASKQQHAYHPIMADPPKEHHKFEKVYLKIVGVILLLAVTTNLLINEKYKEYANTLPWIGLAVWLGILGSTLIKKPHWEELKKASKQAIFLSSLILSASMMPIKDFGEATIVKTFGLGVASAGFDNIPLTAIAIAVGGFVWGLLAYAVGFGGSMTPFGSSAGVSILAKFPESNDTIKWCKEGLFIPVSYVIGFGAIVLYTDFF